MRPVIEAHGLTILLDDPVIEGRHSKNGIAQRS